VILGPQEAPILLVTVDAEAEFDWNAPKRRDALGVGSILKQDPAQEIFADYGITPTYLYQSVWLETRGGIPKRAKL
jgi:hypothetical protein